MATAFINDLIWTGTGIATSIRQTSTTILARIGRTAVNHLFTVLSLIASLADTLIIGAIAILTIATIHAREVETMARLCHRLVSTASELFLVPEQTNRTLSQHESIQASALQESSMLLTWHDKELTLGLNDFSGAWIGNGVISAAQTNHVSRTLAVESVQLVDTFTTGTGFMTTGHGALVNILFTELTSKAGLAHTAELFLLVHQAFGLVLAKAARTHWRVVALADTVAVVVVEVGALGTWHTVKDVDVRANDVALIVPWVAELGDVAVTQVLFSARIGPDFQAKVFTKLAFFFLRDPRKEMTFLNHSFIRANLLLQSSAPKT